MPAALFDASSHEPLTSESWDEARARRTIAGIAAEAEAAFDPDALWPVHPLDDEDPSDPLPPTLGLYLGAAGMVWGLDALARAGLVTLTRDWAPFAATLPNRYAAKPDLPEWTDGKPVPSLLAGESGVLLAAHRVAPDPGHVDRMVECIYANATNRTRELMWGSPGSMLAGWLMYTRTGDERLADAWRESAEWLIGEWGDLVWLQQLYGREFHFIGPGHGFAGNVYSLTRGDLLDDGRRAQVQQRAVSTLQDLAKREGELAQWWPTLEPPTDQRKVRTQWCHGAPGVVTSFADIASDSAELAELLIAGGELTWQAGPLVKGPSICHGTAGNGFAFLKLYDRTGDERWLERARAFAVHAAGQVERLRAEHGRGRYSLWTGDVGVALYLAACIRGDSAMPTLDVY